MKEKIFKNNVCITYLHYKLAKYFTSKIEYLDSFVVLKLALKYFPCHFENVLTEHHMHR